MNVYLAWEISKPGGSYLLEVCDTQELAKKACEAWAMVTPLDWKPVNAFTVMSTSHGGYVYTVDEMLVKTEVV